MDDKWTVIKDGNETAWSLSKVENDLKNGKTYMKFGYGLAIILFIILWIWLTIYTPDDWTFWESLGDICVNPVMWIIVVLFLIGSHGAKLYENAKNAKEVYGTKRKKLNLDDPK